MQLNWLLHCSDFLQWLEIQMECIAMQNSWKQVDYSCLDNNICIHYACDIIKYDVKRGLPSLEWLSLFFFFDFISFIFSFFLFHSIPSCPILSHLTSSHFLSPYLFSFQFVLFVLYISFICIFSGEGGVERDPIEAGKLFSELADQGHPFAQVKGFI